MNLRAHSSLPLIEMFAAAVISGALIGCSSSKQPSNSPPNKATAVHERTDADMKPGRVLADCRGLKAGGSYLIHEGASGKEVSFFLDREAASPSIRKLQDLLGSGDYTLNHKEPHAARIPMEDAASLWLDVAHADGGSLSLRVFDGTLLVASDGVTDWHWSGGSPQLYYQMVDALAPSADEQHVERSSSKPADDGADARAGGGEGSTPSRD